MTLRIGKYEFAALLVEEAIKVSGWIFVPGVGIEL